MSDISNVHNLLFLTLTSSSGTVDLLHSLPNQSLILKKAIITWDSVGDSTSNGSYVNLDIDAFSHMRINSNRSNNINALPIFNDTTKQVTLYTLDAAVDTDSNMKQAFQYKIFAPDGTLVSNFTSMELIFGYTEPAIL